ncbi:response regulator [Winogradskyella sp. PG-2]|uniref:response regulator n=1 Tax=Winogradskyella sp. PG-2 TaxID=754409 RepID=UPI00045866A6|nr:response regulator transcription factor [Winogradskyella sp. PG-2]BAO75525.1 DNA-binding response regulator, LuxR family [Winogradskyella sp. PG-2]
MLVHPKKILICEDHQIVIDGLVSIFNNQPDYTVLDYVKNGMDVLPMVKETKPDVLLLDLNLPNKNGLDILKEIKLYNSEIKVIILTMYNKESVVKKVKQYNGNGFLIKNCSSDDLLRALDSVFESNAFYRGKGVKNNVVETDGFLEKIKITRREKEIILELVKGNNVPQIAKALFISTYTVETHKKNIFKKLDIHNTIDLVKLVNEKQLFS